MPAGLTTPLKSARILLVADIHGNFPALEALSRELDTTSFDHVVNCGDSLVYAPFPKETLNWLARHNAVSILGNTDSKVIQLLKKQPFKKPRKAEKRIMYTTTADALDEVDRRTLMSFPNSRTLSLEGLRTDTNENTMRICIFHGSPEDPDEFLFADTPDSRFHELATHLDCSVVVTGHSHSPYHKYLSGIHFINPGSTGRMFDNDPRISCAILEISDQALITVRHLRISYDISRVVSEIRRQGLPEIYATMFLQGKKLN